MLLFFPEILPRIKKKNVVEKLVWISELSLKASEI